jgi:hypothetical protein
MDPKHYVWSFLDELKSELPARFYEMAVVCESLAAADGFHNDQAATVD